MIVVLVLITNCHVSEKLKIGPDSAQTMIKAKAIMVAAGLPAARVVAVEMRSNKVARIWGTLLPTGGFFVFIMYYVMD